MVESRVLQVDDISVLTTWKRMRNIRLRIVPPEGEVRVSAPLGVPPERISRFVREQRPGNTFHLTAPKPGDGAFPGSIVAARDDQPVACDPGAGPASLPVLHVAPATPQPGPSPILEPIRFETRAS